MRVIRDKGRLTVIDFPSLWIRLLPKNVSQPTTEMPLIQFQEISKNSQPSVMQRKETL